MRCSSDTIDPSRMGVIVNAWKHDTDLLKNQYKREIKKYYMPKKYSEMAEQVDLQEILKI